MAKKMYSVPRLEVMQLGPEIIMNDLGPASVPAQSGNVRRHIGDIIE